MLNSQTSDDKTEMCFLIMVFTVLQNNCYFYHQVHLNFDSRCTLTETKIAEFANSVDLDEVAQNEPPHLDLHCLPSSL